MFNAILFLVPRPVPVAPGVEVELGESEKEKWRELSRRFGEVAVNVAVAVAGYATIISTSLGISVAAVTLVVVIEFLLGKNKGA